MRKYLAFLLLSLGPSSFLLMAPFLSFSQNDSLIFYPINNPVLQQLSVNWITAAKDGKLWLSTINGLVSFDGSDIHSYTNADHDSTSLSGHIISRTFTDEKGNLFVVITGEKQGIYGHIDYFDTKTGKAVRYKIKIAREDSSGYRMEQPFLNLCKISDSVFLAGRTGMGFIEYNARTRKAQNYTLLSARNTGHNSVYMIRQDIHNKDLYWLATNDGIYSFNRKSIKLERRFFCKNLKDSTDLDVDLRDLRMGNGDTIWFISHIRGFGHYNIKTGQYTIFPYVGKDKKEQQLFGQSFQYMGNGEYMIHIDYGHACRFNIATRKYSFNLKESSVIPRSEGSNLIFDSVGNAWVGPNGKLYLAKGNSGKFTTVPIQDRVYKDRYPNAFKTVVWDERRKVYYAAFHMSDGIFIFNEHMQFVRSIPGPRYRNPNWGFVETSVTDIGIDKKGRLWMCGDLVTIYDSVKQRLIPVENVYPKLKTLHQQFRNFVFRGNYLYALPANALSRYLYRVNVDYTTCDSLLLPDIPIAEKQPFNQLGPLEMDDKGENAYISNKNTVYQYNLLTGKTRKVIELTEEEKVFAHFSNFHWYNLDDDGNLWVSSLNKTSIIEPINLNVTRVIERQPNTWFNQAYNIKGKGIMSYANSTSFDLYDYKNWKHYKLTINDGLISYLNWNIALANNMLFVGPNNYMQYIPWTSVIKDTRERKCYLSGIQVFNKPMTTDTLPEYLHSLKLTHDKNYVSLTFSCVEFNQPERLEYRYKLVGVDKDWVYVNYLNRTVSYTNLAPGNYTFNAAVKNDDGSWGSEANNVNLSIAIIPAWWQTSSFKIFLALVILAIFLSLAFWRIRAVRKKEQMKAAYEKELLELEAKALRAQMNPHFIFNSLNSIKSLINKGKNEHAAEYLTTFSKLIRTLFQNSDKREISLYEELETCKLYTQIEKMRFGDKVNFLFDIDPVIDLKDVKVPALILQPFVENAIWHGLVPKESGGRVQVSVSATNGTIKCAIDDDGIGRVLSKQFKERYETTHQSKGIGLTQSRLELDKILNNRNDTINIIDKIDEEGRATGTTVILLFELHQAS